MIEFISDRRGTVADLTARRGSKTVTKGVWSKTRSFYFVVFSSAAVWLMIVKMAQIWT
jgi:hypothetical protein